MVTYKQFQQMPSESLKIDASVTVLTSLENQREEYNC